MTVKLIRGRSKQSHLVVAGHNVHCFVWVPWLHNSESTGVTVRVRRNGGWDHYRVIFWQRNQSSAKRWLAKSGARVKGRSGTMVLRPTITLFEATRWRTAPGPYERFGLKQYVRLKMSAGGREIRNDVAHDARSHRPRSSRPATHDETGKGR